MKLNSRRMTISLGRAFSVVEIVLVIALIALITTITLRVGVAMVDSGKMRATEGVLQVLDQVLDDYMNTTGSIPPALVAVTLSKQIGSQDVGDIVYYPAIDGVCNLEISSNDGSPLRHHQVNSVGLFIASIQHATGIEQLTSQIDNKLIRHYDVHDDIYMPPTPGIDEDLQPSMLTVFDAWGNPIRYVHPKFDGILESSPRRILGEPGGFLDVFNTDPTGPGFFTREYLPEDLTEIPFITSLRDPIIRRNKILLIDQEDVRQNGDPDEYPIETDSDGGKCPGQRPYFYSAGPDGNPATIEDNVYTIRPEFIDPL